MKKHASKIIALFIMVAVAVYIPMAKSSSHAADAVIKNLEGVLFEKLPGKERISLVVSQQPEIKAEGQTNGSLLVRLEDTVAAENLRRSLGEGQLNNILRVTPSQQKVNGKQWTNLMIDIRELVPYSIKKEGKNILIDFNVAGLAIRKPVAPVPPVAASPAKTAPAPAAEAQKPTAAVAAEVPKAKPTIKEEPPKYTQRRISIDFQDAEIKSVLRLMAEYGDVNIVAGDDVKGKVTLAMKNVPWEQALDTILEVNSLSKRQEYNVITVTTMAKSRKDSADREKQRAVDQKILSEKGLLKQILIEAKIVEATETFARDLGVQWRFGFADYSAGSQDRFFGSSGGTGSGGGSVWSGGTAAPLINVSPLLTGPAIGLVYGGLNAVIDAQISALETNGTGKIISAPKVVTMEGMPATIKQGEEIPYVTRDDDGKTNVEFKEALLKLEVTPRITEEGKISMDIIASNDRADWTKVDEYEIENPSIVKNEVKSQLVVNNNDTIVIGGVSIDEDTTTDSGLPWLKKIPILGYLFKTSIARKDKKQLLIFVRPRILESDSVAQSGYKTID